MDIFTFEKVHPENIDINSRGLSDLVSYSNSLSDGSGLLILCHDKVLLEHYLFADETTQWDTQSTTKSFGAALLLCALDEGKIHLNDSVCDRDDMTVHHLASMTAGFPKPHDISCQTELLFLPGTDFLYSDGGTNILRDVVAHAFGEKDITQALRDRVLKPIGANNWTWDGRFNAGLSITIRGLALYGRLWLRKGDWDGIRLLSESNVILASRASNPGLMKSYGYLWWVNSHGEPQPYEKYGFKLNPVFGPRMPRDAFMAIGASRTFILVIPSLQVVAVRSGTGFHSIQSGDTKLTDESRMFTDLVLSAVIEDNNHSNGV
jgi:CubicO group peptidase (beta-lactamase class C family)